MWVPAVRFAYVLFSISGSVQRRVLRHAGDQLIRCAVPRRPPVLAARRIIEPAWRWSESTSDGRTTCPRPLKQVFVRLFTHRRRRRTCRSRTRQTRQPRSAASCRRDDDALQKVNVVLLSSLLQRQLATFWVASVLKAETICDLVKSSSTTAAICLTSCLVFSHAQSDSWVHRGSVLILHSLRNVT